LGNREDQLRFRLRNFIRHVFKDDFPVFLICLIIALLMWIAVKLSGGTTYSVGYPVEYTNLPEGKIIASVSAPVIQLDIELTGADLVRQKFLRSHSPLIISVKDLPVRNTDTLDVIQLATTPLIREIERQLDVINTVNRISPDTVYIGLITRQDTAN
jgi:hypothetical protein